MIFGKISGNIVLGVTVGNLDKENNEVEHLGKSAQYCVHFLPIARTVSPISGEKLWSFKIYEYGRRIFSFLHSKYFFSCGLTVVYKCGYERQKLPLYKNMEEENREIQCEESTQIHKCGMEVVLRQLWQVCAWKCGNCHFTQASAEPQMWIQTLLSPQNIRREKESFSVEEKKSGRIPQICLQHHQQCLWRKFCHMERNSC